MNVIKKPLAAWLLGLALITNLQAAETMTEARDVEVKMVVLDIDEVDNKFGYGSIVLKNKKCRKS